MGTDRQSYTEYITCLHEVTFLQYFAKQQHGYGVAHVLLVQLGVLGQRCKLPQRVRMEPGAEWYLLHFGLKRLLMRAISHAYSWKKKPQSWQVNRFGLRSFETFVYWRTSALRCPDPEVVGDRYNAPLEYLQPTTTGIDYQHGFDSLTGALRKSSRSLSHLLNEFLFSITY